VDHLLAPTSSTDSWITGSLSGCICCKASSNACPTAVILDAIHGSVQHPAHNSVADNLPFTEPFLALHDTSECDVTAHDIITTPTDARGLYVVLILFPGSSCSMEAWENLVHNLMLVTYRWDGRKGLIVHGHTWTHNSKNSKGSM